MDIIGLNSCDCRRTCSVTDYIDHFWAVKNSGVEEFRVNENNPLPGMGMSFLCLP